MKMSWQTETDRVVCRWSEMEKRVRYDPRWIQDAAREVETKNVPASIPDFTKLSPFGGSEWYGPGRERA